MQQGLLPLSYPQSIDLCDFVVANCNQLAFDLLHKTISGTAKEQFICIYGEPGCGKTHLLHGFAAENNIIYLNTKHVIGSTPREWGYGDAKIIILDDADQVNDDVWWFHLYNFIKEQNKILIIGARKAPLMWSVQLADLRSRLSTFVCAEMRNPDDDTLKRVLEKIWKDKGIVVNNAILEYLSRRIDRNFPAICHWANKIDLMSAKSKRPITISMLHTLFTNKDMVE